jgi:hypothetical protein
MSEASRRKQDNSNFINPIMEQLNNNPITVEVHRVLIATTGQYAEKQYITEQRPIEGVLEIIGSMGPKKAQSAVLGAAIKMMDSCRNGINVLTSKQIAEVFEINIPSTVHPIMPTIKQVSVVPIAGLLELAKVEDIIMRITADAMGACGTLLLNALAKEAIAANWGKQVANNDGIIRRIANTPVSRLQPQTVLPNGTLVVRTEENIYGEGIKDIDAQAKAQYDTAQKEVNALLKQIKDILRDLDSKYLEQYRKDMEVYNAEKHEYDSNLARFETACQQAKSILQRELANMKIVDVA